MSMTEVPESRPTPALIGLARRSLWRHAFWLLAALPLALSGCSDEETGTVTMVDVADIDVEGDTAAPPPPVACETWLDCLGVAVGPCSVPACDSAEAVCVALPRPDCCVSDDDCNAGATGGAADPAPERRCDTELGRCVSVVGTPCDGPEACPAAGPCTLPVCLGGVCAEAASPDCCDTPLDCDDGDPCTDHTCTDGRCGTTPQNTPACCATLVYGATFSGDLEGAEVSGNGEAVAWHLSTVRDHSPGGSLHFADPESGRYENPIQDGKIPASAGAVATPTVALPAGKTLTLVFWLWLDVERLPEFDELWVEIESDGLFTPVWNKDALPDEDYKSWTRVAVDVSDYAGQSVRFHFRIDTLDGTVNGGEGAFLDDLVVQAACGDEPECVADADCADDDACTEDRCTDGACTSGALAGCCSTVADCATTGDPCDVVSCVDAQCVTTVAPACANCGGSCDDGDPCTDEACVLNACQYYPIPGCAPECVTAAECAAPPVPCAVPTCDFGICGVDTEPGCCTADESCDDGDPCTTNVCSNNACTFTEIPNCGGCIAAEDCFDGLPCTADACVFGACQNPPIVGCEDECQTTADCQAPGTCTTIACVQGFCLESPLPGCCTSDASCEDDDPCTVNVCDDGACTVSPPDPSASCCNENAECADPDPCTADLCVENQCQNLAVPGCGTECTSAQGCSDGNACTQDACVGGKCTYTTLAGCCVTGAECQDGDICTADICDAGTCVNVTIPGCVPPCTSAAQCSDGNVCTTDSCVMGTCTFTPKTGCCTTATQCNDGDGCTADFCTNGVCQNVAIPGCVPPCTAASQCSDGDACTADFCTNGACQNVAIPGCVPPCTSASQCSDGDGCTADFCTNGACQNIAIPGCVPPCTTASQCSDGDPCTADFCTGGVCLNTPVPGCQPPCQSNAQCDDGNPCTQGTCSNGTCSYSPIAGCCTQNSGCNDQNACTADFCTQNKCQSLTIPGCCTESLLLQQSFDAANALTGWQVTGTGGSTWQRSTLLSLSSPGSLRFGNAATGTYGTEGVQVAGAALTPAFTIPSASKGAVATFFLYADVETTPDFDTLNVLVRPSGAASGTVLWTKDNIMNFGSWVAVTVNLSAWIGQTVRLELRTDSVDGVDNAGAGYFIDDLAVRATCTAVPTCQSDTECNDGDSCTKDRCSGGLCVADPIPECCQSASDCDDGFTCTTDACQNGTCVYAEQPGCCQTDDECDDGNTCSVDLCQDGACKYAAAGAPGCCKAASDCEDGSACTTHTCSAFQCKTTAVTGPGCCAPTTLLNATFDTGTAPGFTIFTDGGLAKWSPQTRRFFSPAYSLYFGIPGAWNYQTEPPPSGTAATSALSIPATAAKATLSFRIWASVSDPFTDVFAVRVVSGTTLKTVYTSAAGTLPQGQWSLITVDLSAFIGTTVSLQFGFEAIFPSPAGEGIHLDNINLQTSCQ
ncbi:MAG: hypothetical protein IV100_12760 [Myxococcales bacterium]|nr:hypothetical protein [Myxococcales bacterium]